MVCSSGLRALRPASEFESAQTCFSSEYTEMILSGTVQISSRLFLIVKRFSAMAYSSVFLAFTSRQHAQSVAIRANSSHRSPGVFINDFSLGNYFFFEK
jgi:hypothetical protein